MVKALEVKKEKGDFKMIKVGLVIIYLILTISGLIFMKMGGNFGTISLASGRFNFSMSLTSMVGFACYICGFLMFTQLVTMFDLSYLIPITTGVVQVATLIAAVKIFKEDITTQGVIGIILVIGGIVLMNLKLQK